MASAGPPRRPAPLPARRPFAAPAFRELPGASPRPRRTGGPAPEGDGAVGVGDLPVVAVSTTPARTRQALGKRLTTVNQPALFLPKKVAVSAGRQPFRPATLLGLNYNPSTPERQNRP